MFGIRNLENAALGVIGQKDFAIAVGIVSILRCNVTIRYENNEAPIRADIAHYSLE